MISKRRVLKYVLLPEVLPRMGRLFIGGFAYIAYLTAMVFYAVRLIPPGHAYLQPANFGRFGIRHAIAAAAENLKYDRRHIDQILVFYTILAGMVILMAQLVLAGLTLFASPVYALPVAANFGDWFLLRTGSPFWDFDGSQDLAMVTLDRIFGVQGIFNSCISTAVNCLDHRGEPISESAGGAYPWPMHIALHNLFRMYSIGISILSLMIIIYYITTIIGETVVTGTPFGQRFNRAWAPVRLIVFAALLAPLNLGGPNGGLNGAQLITLGVAKFGSNFATNAWGYFNNTMAGTTLGTRTLYEPEQLIAIPQTPEFGTLPQFFSAVHACIFAEKMIRNRDIIPYLVRGGSVDPTVSNPIASNSVEFMTTPLATAVGPAPPAAPASPAAPPSPPAVVSTSFSEHGVLTLRFGIKDVNEYGDFAGGVKPICGELSIPVSGIEEYGAYSALYIFYETMLRTAGSGYITGTLAEHVKSISDCVVMRELRFGQALTCTLGDPIGTYDQVVRQHFASLETNMNTALITLVSGQITRADLLVRDLLLQRGWAAAAIWYNKIAQINGAVVDATFNVPKPKLFPELMEDIKAQRLAAGESSSGPELFNPEAPEGRVLYVPAGEYPMAKAYYQLYKMWDTALAARTSEVQPTSNVFIDTINQVFGTSGLFDMRRGPLGAVHPGNMQVHPLALLSALGRSMIEASIINLGISFGTGIMAIFDPLGMGAALKAASSFFSTVAMATISIGIVLYYVLPFLPFVYFFFAFGGWVKSIFEAMVAMPLWALAHLRIDGPGLPGPGATNGYFLLLEIFLRPILTLFGLLASLVIYAAMVHNLNNVFDIMTVNVGGSNREAPVAPTDIDFWRGPIDELFYTVIYAVLVYMMGLSSFKLIDTMPGQILRWIGASVSTFHDNNGDPAGQLTGQMYRGSQLSVNQITGALNPGQIAALTAR